MKILNTGGTFNKRYDPILGVLEVPFDNEAVEDIVESFAYSVEIAGMLYKDSLEMTEEDREQLINIIDVDDEEVYVIVHGTDTMDLTAKALAEWMEEDEEERVIVLTGAMVPYSIDKTEASVNLGMALGYAATQPAPGVYICMSGIIAPYDRIRKNRGEGIFEIV
ncbi:asparaginase [Sulfurimonas sp. HSL-3221]|uniref:asparaginase domain-containing protein n=1 Tax=Sulfurimonadaceae TaxID=2771471 RepID=UPI001E46DFBD|nr:asparaginase domain-containing protein [Sulfurimonas sp. HSL-3221]UFS63078.1 asparaginase [Sulfurimonas sp. HSL-3221]